jgi:hypothetical protein
MKAMRIVGLMCLLICSCQPGGGGTIQEVPDTIPAGGSAAIRLTVSVWELAEISKDDIRTFAHYKLVGEDTYKTAEAKRISADRKQEVMS